MFFFTQVCEDSQSILDYLQKRNLLKQYKKAKAYILLGYFAKIDLRKREPKNENIFYFKVNEKYRAWCYQK